jgi:tetratricopeptide (TPR) repeat protein
MDLSKHLEAAEEAVRRRNYAYAINLYHQLLDLKPDDGDARRGLRKALAKKFEGKKVSPVIGVLSGLLPLLTAALARATRNHKGVARAYEKYLLHDPFNRGANLKLAQALQRAGAQRSAAVVYEFLAERDPANLVALKAGGALFYQLKDFPRALRMFEQALAADPKDAEALRARKNLAAEGALTTSGLQTARSARELAKDKKDGQELDRGERLHRTEEEIGDELAQAEARIAKDPKDIKALTRRAELLEARGDKAKALQAFEAAVAAQPESFDLSVRTGDLRLLLLRDGGAGEPEVVQAEITEYRRRVKAHPTDPALRYQLGAALLRDGQLDEAVAEFQQSVRDPRQKLDSLLMLGQAFLGKGLLDLARAQLEKALEAVPGISPRSKDILYNLGVIAEKQGKRDDASRFYMRIYEADIGFKDVSKKIEQLKV